MRARAADVLGEIGPQARPALPALQQLLEDEDFTVRTIAASAIHRIGD